MIKKKTRAAPTESSEPIAGDESAAPVAPQGRLWIWFVIGCLLAFIGTLATPMFVYEGVEAKRVPMAQYYLVEFSNLGSDLGPGSSDSGVLVTNIVQHLLISLAGGAFLYATGWGIPKLFAKSPKTTK